MEFPLCKAAGLEIYGDFIGAQDVESLLSSAPVVKMSDHYCSYWREPHQEINDATHTARLLLIEPIAPPESAEDLLREMLNFGSVDKSESFYERAKRILARLDKGEK